MIARLTSNFLGLFLVRGLAVLGPLIVMPYLVKTVGLDGWGRISFAIAVTTFGGAIVQYGFSISGTADLARARHDPALLESNWRAHFVTTLALALVVLVIGFGAVLVFETDFEMRLLLLGALLISVATSLVPLWLFMALERMIPAVVSSACYQLGYAAVILWIVRGPSQLAWVTLVGGAAATAGLLVSLVQVRRQFGLPIPLTEQFSKIARTLREGFSVFLMMFVPLLYNAGGAFMLGVTFSKAEVAILTVPATLVEVAIVGGRLLANAALALVATEASRFAKFARYTMGAGMLAAIAMAGLAPWIARWLTPEHAAEVTLVMTILAVSVPFGFAHLVFGQNYLAISGHSTLASRIVIVSSIIGAVLTVAVVPLAGATGAAGVICFSRMLLGGQSILAYLRVR